MYDNAHRTIGTRTSSVASNDLHSSMTIFKWNWIKGNGLEFISPWFSPCALCVCSVWPKINCFSFSLCTADLRILSFHDLRPFFYIKWQRTNEQPSAHKTHSRFVVQRHDAYTHVQPVSCRGFALIRSGFVASSSSCDSLLDSLSQSVYVVDDRIAIGNSK